MSTSTGLQATFSPIFYIPLIITGFGWIAVYWLNLRQQNKALKNQANLKVYEELAGLFHNLDEKLGIELYTKITDSELTVFLGMELAKKGIIVDATSPTALDCWNKYHHGVFTSTDSVIEGYRSILARVGIWLGLMPDLKIASNILSQEFNKLQDKLYDHIHFLTSKTPDLQNSHIWKTEVMQRSKELGNDIEDVLRYSDTFLNLIYNELVSPITGHKIGWQENYINFKGRKLAVLTKEGIKELEIK